MEDVICIKKAAHQVVDHSVWFPIEAAPRIHTPYILYSVHRLLHTACCEGVVVESVDVILRPPTCGEVVKTTNTLCAPLYRTQGSRLQPGNW